MISLTMYNNENFLNSIKKTKAESKIPEMLNKSLKNGLGFKI